jgi:hypothetical protein
MLFLKKEKSYFIVKFIQKDFKIIIINFNIDIIEDN